MSVAVRKVEKSISCHALPIVPVPSHDKIHRAGRIRPPVSSKPSRTLHDIGFSRSPKQSAANCFGTPFCRPPEASVCMAVGLPPSPSQVLYSMPPLRFTWTPTATLIGCSGCAKKVQPVEAQLVSVMVACSCARMQSPFWRLLPVQLAAGPYASWRVRLLCANCQPSM